MFQFGKKLTAFVAFLLFNSVFAYSSFKDYREHNSKWLHYSNHVEIIEIKPYLYDSRTWITWFEKSLSHLTWFTCECPAEVKIRKIGLENGQINTLFNIYNQIIFFLIDFYPFQSRLGKISTQTNRLTTNL